MSTSLTTRFSNAVTKFTRRNSTDHTTIIVRDHDIDSPTKNSVAHLLKNRQEVMTRYQGSRIAKFRVGSVGGDTPGASLKRLYQFFVVGWTSQAASEVGYFWNQGGEEWQLARVPEPVHPDRVRRGIMVVLMRLMCKDFNAAIAKGYPRGSALTGLTGPPPENLSDKPLPEVLPEWVEQFTRVTNDEKEWVQIPDAKGFSEPDDPGVSEDFKKVGIVVKETKFRLKVP